MINDEKIKRINELAHKQKNGGLTEQERKEQHQLRLEYVEAVKGNLRHHIEGIKIIDENGETATPKKRKKAKKDR